MATADSVKTKIQGLIDAANGATGGNATDLTGAINSLIDTLGCAEIKEISRIEVNEPVSAITIPIGTDKDYDFISVDTKGLTFSQNDWIYAIINSLDKTDSTHTIGYYGMIKTCDVMECFTVSIMGKSIPIANRKISANEPVEYIALVLWTEGTTFTSGTVVAYGGKWNGV